MRIAPEGWPFIAAAAVPTAAVAALAVGRGGAGWAAGAVALGVLTAWVTAFFRDPRRDGARGPDVVIAPADGRVVSVERVDEPAFVGGPARRVSIFMSVFDVHVNRYPVSGTIGYAHYHAGRFLHAASDKASLDNEQMSIGIDTGSAKVLVRQIAGLVARRIVTDGRVGDAVVQGERLGLIRFGSRVDVFLPPDAAVAVAVGDRTAAGATVIARLDRA